MRTGSALFRMTSFQTAYLPIIKDTDACRFAKNLIFALSWLSDCAHTNPQKIFRPCRGLMFSIPPDYFRYWSKPLIIIRC